MSDAVNEKTLESILGHMKEMLEKAQICQGPPSSMGNMADMHPDNLQGMESRVDATGMDYVPTPPGQDDPEAGVSKSDEEDKAQEEEINKAKKKEKKRGKKKEGEEGEDVQEMKDPEQKADKVMKSEEAIAEVPTTEDDGVLVYPVDAVMYEITKSIESAFQSLTERVDWALGVINEHHLETLKSLSGNLAHISEEVIKAYSVVEEESNEPVRAPKSVMSTQDMQKSSDTGKKPLSQLSSNQVLDMMFKSIMDGNNIVNDNDISRYETTQEIREVVANVLDIDLSA